MGSESDHDHETLMLRFKVTREKAPFMGCLTSFVHFEDMTFFPGVLAIFLFANIYGDSDRTRLALTAEKHKS
jgi:hypothetical protein